MRRADSTLAKPTQRERWLERTTEERSPADRDFLTWSPTSEWRAPRGFRPVRATGLLKTTRGAPAKLHNEQYVGRAYAASPAVIAEELVKAKAALDPQLLPGLLTAVLIERKVNRDRVRVLVAERFGPAADDDLKRLASIARHEIESHLATVFGFLPQYQLRWVGTIEHDGARVAERKLATTSVESILPAEAHRNG